MQWLNGNISFFVRKCILDSFLTVLTEYDASKYALCTFFHFTMRYTGILRTLEILYMCARVFTFKTQQNNKKSFLLNDLHLRNRDKPLTILFLLLRFWFLYISCQSKLSRCCLRAFSSFSLFPFIMVRRKRENLYVNWALL